MVVDGDGGRDRVSEVWEAKAKISPSSVWDSQTKKLPSLRDVEEDAAALLVYGGGDRTAFLTAPPVRADGRVGGGRCTMTFGLASLDLLPPPNAVGQLRAIEAACVLRRGDVGVITAALDRGHVEVDAERIRRKIDLLRGMLREASKGFRIRLVLVQPEAGDNE